MTNSHATFSTNHDQPGARGRVLLIEDDGAMADVLRSALVRRGFDAEAITEPARAADLIAAGDHDAVVTDLNMPGLSGIDLCRTIKSSRPELPVILITAFGSLDTAVQAIRAGAYDFVTKPLDPDQLGLALDRAVALHRVKRELSTLRRRAQGANGSDLLGDSAAMLALRQTIEHVASTDTTVLVQGETGTGKELVARALHAQSARRDGPWVAINCASLPENLLESELFGHERGAFTDARSQRRGLFAQASGGTLLLDEIGDMPLPLQSKILRVLETRSARPVGGDREVSFDVRVIAATHQDLEAAVREGRFRQDLLYRLDVLRLELPPLRARGNDVLLLAQRFVVESSERMKRRVIGMSGPAASALLRYSWPGNVRELRNCIERSVATTRYEHIGPEDLPEKVRTVAVGTVTPSPSASDALVSLDEAERQYVYRVLAAVGGNRSAAAEILCIDRKTLTRKLDRWNTDQESG